MRQSVSNFYQRRKRFTLLLALSFVTIVSCVVATVVMMSGLLKPSRDDYTAYDFSSQRWQIIFESDYETAIANGENWIQDPRTTALRVAGYPNEDNTSPKSVEMLTVGEDRVIVTVLSGLLHDDSIKRRETRIELVRNDQIWEVEWAGWRQQCYKAFVFGWTTGLCP